MNVNPQVSAQINEAIARETYTDAFNRRQKKEQNALSTNQLLAPIEEDKKDAHQPKANPQDAFVRSEPTEPAFKPL
jgi:hypothetical protein